MADLTAAFQFVADNAPTVDDINDWSARGYALGKDCPGKLWWDADPMHPAICRALRIDSQDEGAVFAKAPFRLAKIENAHVILAAYPAPRLLGPVDGDWLGIETVMAWDPRTDACSILGDVNPQAVGPLTDETPRLYGSARTFFTDWLVARAGFFVRWVESRRGEWAHGAIERDLAPGALAIGSIDKIAWRPSSLPAHIEAIGIDPAHLNRALLRAANIPRATTARSRMAA